MYFYLNIDILTADYKKQNKQFTKFKDLITLTWTSLHTQIPCRRTQNKKKSENWGFKIFQKKYFYLCVQFIRYHCSQCMFKNKRMTQCDKSGSEKSEDIRIENQPILERELFYAALKKSVKNVFLDQGNIRIRSLSVIILI